MKRQTQILRYTKLVLLLFSEFNDGFNTTNPHYIIVGSRYRLTRFFASFH